jgi:hypothetical protein
MKRKRGKIIDIGVLLLVSAFAFFGCTGNASNANLANISTASQPKNASNVNSANNPNGTQPETAASFINKVWKVKKSASLATGQLYVFLSEGTLVITSLQSKPALGSWTYKNGALTITEESITYKVDIVKLTGSEFSIKIHNPGPPTEIEFVPAT